MKADRKSVLLTIALTGGLCFLFLLFITGCPVRRVVGVPCPGCGMTRAVVYAARLHFREAWRFHPLFWTPPLALLLLKRWKRKWVRPTLAVIFAAVYAGVYIARLVNGVIP